MSERDRLDALCLEYALGTLEGDERAEIEARLAAGEPEAEAALAAARDAVAALALAAPVETPSPEVRERLMLAAAGSARVAEFPARRLARLSPVAWAAAAAGLVCAALLWGQLREARRAIAALELRLDDLRGRQELAAAESERNRRILDILAAPDTFGVDLEAAGRARIRALWNDRQGLVVAGRGIPQPAPGRALQLWVVPRAGDPESVEVFAPDSDGGALILAAPRTRLAEAAALAITEEPAGGSPAPTSAPIWMGQP